MTSQNFIYFLQGYFEITDPKTISAKDLAKIKGHLKLAFRDDIDPSMGTKEHQQTLSALHEGKMDLNEFLTQNPHLNPHGNTYQNSEVKERC